MGNHISINAKDRDDLMAQLNSILVSLDYASLPLFVSHSSGMGSAKTRHAANVPTKLKDFRGLMTVVEKNQHLLTQIWKAFDKFVDKSKVSLILPSKNINAVISEIRKVIISGKVPILFLTNVTHREGKLSANAQLLEGVFKAFNNVDKLTIIDEWPDYLTEITGGINAKLDHNTGIMIDYNKSISQTVSLNIFDMLRKYNVKCIGLSGTAYGALCSKMPSTGYDKKDICIVNVYPIKSLYDKLKITSTNLSNFDNLTPKLEEFEKSNSDSKCLIAVQKIERIKEFAKAYEKKYGRKMKYVKITGDNKKERESPAFLKKLKEAKYVFGVKMIDTGLDLSTWVEGQQFRLGILYTLKSDAISWPLSKNKDHDFHMDTAASLMQLLARLRDGGEWLIPEEIDDRPLYNRLVQVYTILEKCLDEYDWVGGVAYETQRGRVHQLLVKALIQNLKRKNRPIVADILIHLKVMTGRTFEDEVLANIDTPLSFPHEFWSEAMACLWSTWDSENNKLLSEEEKHQIRNLAFEKFRRGEFKTGGGFRKERTYDEEQLDIIWGRGGIDKTCAHCGYSGAEQVSHIKTFASGGNLTNNSKNCVISHTSCDSMIDAKVPLIIYDIDGKHVWLKRHAKINKPDRKQLEAISQENFVSRWDKQRCDLGQSHLSDVEFRNYMKPEYICREY
jgi:5-methylcytosine-specific restriction endonuclease McrA